MDLLQLDSLQGRNESLSFVWNVYVFTRLLWCTRVADILSMCTVQLLMYPSPSRSSDFSVFLCPSSSYRHLKFWIWLPLISDLKYWQYLEWRDSGLRGIHSIRKGRFEPQRLMKDEVRLRKVVSESLFFRYRQTLWWKHYLNKTVACNSHMKLTCAGKNAVVIIALIGNNW